MYDRDLPELHALSLAPRCARPGETVRLEFRTPNRSAAASPPATVRFILPPELEALDEPVQAVGAVAAGEELRATLCARLAAGLEDGLSLTVRAGLELPDHVLATNRCELRVRSRPVLDGERSGIFVALEDEETVVVRAIVCNEGDGPAVDVELVAAPPLGCERREGEPNVLRLARLDVGECAELRFAARLVSPPAELVADDAIVRCAGGAARALAARERIVLAPALLAPAITLDARRRDVRVAIAVRNDGWVDALDVALDVTLPAPLRPAPESVTIDGVPAARRGRGAFAHVERSGTTTTVRIARIPARACASVVFTVAVPLGVAPAPLRALVGEHEAIAELATAAERALRLRVLDVPPAAQPGDALTLLAEVVNAGDLAESVTVIVVAGDLADAGEPQALTLAPGELGRVALGVRLRDDLADGARVTFTVTAQAQSEVARAACAVIVRDRPCLAAEEPRAVEDGVAYVVRNTGTTTARGLQATFGDRIYALEPLAPSACATLVVSAADARAGGRLFLAAREHLTLHPLDGAAPEDVQITCEVPPEVVAGAVFAVRARVTVPDAIERLALRAPVVAGAAYVAGSTSLDGVTLLDRGGTSPLASQGLLLHGVPGGTVLVLAWSLLADPNAQEPTLAPSLVATACGTQTAASTSVAVRARCAFAAKPAAFAYHVDAYALAPQDETPHETRAPEPAERQAAFQPFEPLVAPRDEAFRFAFMLDEARRERIARTVRSAGGTLAGHLTVVRALLPDCETSGDVQVAAALDAVRAVAEERYDRLFVKLRIPGFRASGSDFEDHALRAALTALFGRLRDAHPGNATYGGVLDAFEYASFGAPAALRALVALLPDACEEPLLSAGLARYAAALDAALARCEGLDEAVYDAALADARCEELDDARAAVLAALRGPAIAGAA